MVEIAETNVTTARAALTDKKLYKYKSLAGDTQKSHFQDILLNNRIRFSQPSELNDIIEGKPILRLGDWKLAACRAQYEEWAWGTQQQATDIPPSDRFIKWFRSLTKEDHEKHVQQLNSDNHAAIEERWRILSLSANPHHELMWTHYSDGQLSHLNSRIRCGLFRTLQRAGCEKTNTV